MRIEGHSKCGFYPVTPATIDLLCRSLNVIDPTKTYIMDPCCGKGVALGQLGSTLNIPKDNRYGIELDTARAEAAKEHGNILHASFFGTRIVAVQSLSLVWLNPPYVDEIKQHPEQERKALETSFVEHAARYVIRDGIMVLHCPLDRMTDTIKVAFFRACTDCMLVELPSELRPYREALLIGKKRAIVGHSRWPEIKQVTSIPTLNVPTGVPFKTFVQVTPTDEEILDSIHAAAFMKQFTRKPKRDALEPLLPLGPGHLGLTLASGLLDGLFCPPGWEPHIVRGIAFKENELAKQESETNPETGKVTTTQVYRENIRLKIRYLTGNGTIGEIR